MASETKELTRSFFVHDNGGRPFYVTYKHKTCFVEVAKGKNTVSKSSVVIYHLLNNGKNNDDDNNKLCYTAFLQYKNPKRVFIGESPQNTMTKFSGGYGKEFLGNTILIEIARHFYVFVGGNIYSFYLNYPIVFFSSPVGNNDVPYPWGMDLKGNIYLFDLDGIVRLRPTMDLLETLLDSQKEPFSDYFYKKHSLKGFENIDEFFIGKTKYSLTWARNPAEEYDRYITSFQKDQVNIYGISVTYKGSLTKQQLSKQAFVDLMKRFGFHRKFSCIPVVNVHARDCFDQTCTINEDIYKKKHIFFLDMNGLPLYFCVAILGTQRPQEIKDVLQVSMMHNNRNTTMDQKFNKKQQNKTMCFAKHQKKTKQQNNLVLFFEKTIKKRKLDFFFRAQRKKKEGFMNEYSQLFLQFFLILAIVAFVIGILIWNLQLCKKTEIAYERYRAVSQEVIYECIEADNMLVEQPMEALLKIAQAKSKLLGIAQLVGGMVTLRVLSGLDVVQVSHFINTIEDKIRNRVVEKGLLKQHPLLAKLFCTNNNDDKQDKKEELP